jgi:putative drug exporter of the RND superfamily
MFKELGEFITRKPWAIIAIWVLVLILMAPLAATLSNNLQYDSSSFIPNNTDSSKAQAIYNQQFPTTDKTQLLVVVESDNQTSSMNFINALNNTVNDTIIQDLSGTASVYGLQSSVLVNMTPTLYNNLNEGVDNASNLSQNLYQGMDNISNASEDLYNLRDAVYTLSNTLNSAYQNVKTANSQLYSAKDQAITANQGMYQLEGMANGDVLTLYGVPEAYVRAWTADGGLNDGQNLTIDDMAMQAANAYINTLIPTGNPDNQLAISYLDSFDEYWRANYVSDPNARAENAIKSIAPSFISSLPSGQQQAMMSGALGYFNLSDITPSGAVDSSTMENFIIDQTMTSKGLASSEDRQKMTSIYNLGSNPSPEAVEQYVLNMVAASKTGTDIQSLTGIYSLGENPSSQAIGSYVVNMACQGKNATEQQLIQNVWDMGIMSPDAVDAYVLQTVGSVMNISQLQTIRDVYAMGPDPNNTTIENYVLDTAANNSGLNATEIESARELLALGRNPSNESLEEYVASQVMNNLNLTGNDSYFLALMNLDRNLSDSQVQAYAEEWADTHSYDNPQLLPHGIIISMVSGNVTIYMVALNTDESATNLINNDTTILRDKIATVKKNGGFADVDAYVTGSAAMNADTKSAAATDISSIDKYTIALVLILLGLFFLSLFTPFVPLAAIVVAIVCSFGALSLVTRVTGIYYVVMILTIVIMMGAGVDYCVFLLSRYSEERKTGASVKSSVIMSVEHAGKSVASSGLTAALGFGALTLTGSGMLVSIGIGVTIGIIVSMIMAITLIPALLTLFGDRLFWPHKLYNDKKKGIVSGFWAWITKGTIKHATLIVVLAVLLTIPATLMVTHLNTGMDIISMLPSSAESKAGYNLLEETMGSGTVDRAMITVTLPMNITSANGNRSVDAMNMIESISSMTAKISDVNTVYSMTRPDGTLIDYTNLSGYSTIERQYYDQYMNNSTGLDDRTTLIYASFNGSPYSNTASQAIQEMRMMFNGSSLQGAEIHVGGMPGITYDLVSTSLDGFVYVLPVVIIGVLFILFLLLKSVFTPIRLVITLLMSIAWTLAAFYIVFQTWLNETLIFLLPILLFCSLMGLGVDYDIFLVSRIREEVMKGKSDEDAIETAVESTGGIITLCGAIMAGAFGTLMLTSMEMTQQMGFILFLAIVLDATVMRLVIVPAIMMLMKKYNWWMPNLKRKTEIMVNPKEKT